MLNPWLTLPLQAVRIGWETQSILADQMMRLAGLGISDQKAAGNFIASLPLKTKLTPRNKSVSITDTSVD